MWCKSITIYVNPSHRSIYQGLEHEDGTKMPHYGKTSLEQVLSAASPEKEEQSCQIANLESHMLRKHYF